MSLASQIKEYLESPISSHKDISYEEYVKTNTDLQYLCSSTEIDLQNIENTFIYHDIQCEFLLLNYLMQNDSHLKEWIQYKHETTNKKNRYSDIIPYAYNTVYLHKMADEKNYINASYIKGWFDCSFIATQNPWENTISDFWLMIINHSISMILFLSYTFEESNDKFVHYWPKATSTPWILNNIGYQVRLVNQLNIIEKYWIIRNFQITSTNPNNTFTLNVTQMHGNCWEEHYAPWKQIGMKVIDVLITKIEDELAGSNKNATILVHCNDGIGRTGTFIAIFGIIKCWMEQKKQGVKNPVINIFNVVRKWREERFGMVNDIEWYDFVHKFCKKWISNNYER